MIYDEYEIGISKNVNLGADRDNYFFTDYCLSTFEGQLQCIPAGQFLVVSPHGFPAVGRGESPTGEMSDCPRIAFVSLIATKESACVTPFLFC